MLQVVLVAPEIATNTGNIIRLCANVGASLHLIEPLGFRMDEARLRRAGLDYHELTSVAVHHELGACLQQLDPSQCCYALSARGTVRYDAVQYGSGDMVVFGAERSGLSAAVLERFPQERRVRIPMRPDNRSMNLANAVAVVLYEAWRQADFTGSAPPGRLRAGSLSEATDAAAFDRGALGP